MPMHNHQLPEGTLTTPEERLDWFCRRFDAEPPQLEYEDGDILLTDELIKFCGREGMSIDWFFLGDLNGLVAATRARWQEQDRVKEMTRDLSKQEVDGLTLALEAVVHDGAPLDEAMTIWRNTVEAARASA